MKRKHKVGLAALALLAVLAYAGKAKAQDAPAPASKASGKEWRLSVGPDAGVPLGDFSNVYNWDLGGSAQIDIPIVQSLYVTVNAGYNDYFVKSALKDAGAKNMQTIPLKAGLRYFPAGNIFYVQAQAGTTLLANKSDLDADKSAAFVYAPQVGVLLKLAEKNYIDVGFRFEGTSSFYDGGSYNNTLGLRVAYSFGL